MDKNPSFINIQANNISNTNVRSKTNHNRLIIYFKDKREGHACTLFTSTSLEESSNPLINPKFSNSKEKKDQT